MTLTPRIKRRLNVAFLTVEAVMHVYLTIYLISIGASILAILFTVFELTMFARLLMDHTKNETEMECQIRHSDELKL